MYPYSLRNYKDEEDITTKILQKTSEISEDNITSKTLQKTSEISESEEKTNLPTKDDKILILLEEAINDEFRDYEYYKRLQTLFDDMRDRETIRHISLDEMKHKKMLEDIYIKISGKKPPMPKPDDIRVTRNLLFELSKSISHEFDGVEFYRKLYFLFKNPEYRDMMFEILTDESIHAGKLTYLYSKYK